MHKIEISEAARARMTARTGKAHPFDEIDPRKAALVVIDMQNYFCKPGHQGEVPASREIVPNINRLAADLRAPRRARRLGAQRHPQYARKLVELSRISAHAGPL